MEDHSVEQCVQIIKFYYQNQCSVRETFRALRDFYSRHNRPAESTIRRLVAKFESTGSINNQPTTVCRRNARSAENIAAVRESVREKSRRSISRRSQELGLSATSTWRILRRDLGLHLYKIQLTQEFKVNDHRQCAMCSLIGFWSSWKLIQISSNKSSLATRPIFRYEWICEQAKLSNLRRIHARYTSSKCISRKSLVGADFGLAESSVRTSSKTKRALP